MNVRYSTDMFRIFNTYYFINSMRPLLFVTTILLSFIFSTGAKAQINHVPNPSFEDTLQCVHGLGQITQGCRYWFNNASSDYYNACTPSNVSTPSNLLGYQVPVSGRAYAGAIVGANSIYREYVATQIDSLMPGALYEVSMYVSLADESRWAANGFGILFVDSGQVSGFWSRSKLDTPQVYFNTGIIYDSVNWVKLVQTYVPDKAYDTIYVGAFNAPIAQKVQFYNSKGTEASAYYYIDSVSVVLPDSFYVTFNDTSLCAGDTATIQYFSLNKNLPSGNTFIFQLSDTAGNYQNPDTIATISSNTSGTFQWIVPNNLTPGYRYRIRAVATATGDFSRENRVPIAIGVNVPAKPVATSNSPVCAYDTLKLGATSTSGSSVIYTWAGPQNFDTTWQNPEITDLDTHPGGAYIVTAKLYGCTSKDTVSVEVINSKILNIESFSSPVCEGDSIYLIAKAPDTSTFSWTGPASFTSTSKFPYILNATESAEGKYYLSATHKGCVVDDSANVIVNPLPATFSISSNSPVCLDDSIKLSANTTSSGVYFTWTGPGNYSSYNQAPSIAPSTFSDSGVYHINVQLGSCTINDSVRVIIKESPGTVTASSNSAVCETDTLKLNATATSSSALVYSWSGPGSFTSAQQNPVLPNGVPAMSGDYIVTASINNCFRSDTISATVKPLPVFTATSNSPLCTGIDLQFSASSSFSGVNYVWSGPNSFTANTSNPVIFKALTVHSGTYYVTSELNNCYLYDTLDVNVKPLPDKPVAANNTPLCAGDTIKLTANTTTSGVTYSWTGAASFTSSQQNPEITSSTTGMSGDYYITVTKNGCSSFDTTTVQVKPMPNAVSLSNNSPICEGSTLQLNSGTSSTGVTYTWSGPASFSANSRNTTISNTPTSATGWYVMTVNLNGCNYVDSTQATIHSIPLVQNITASSPVCVGETLNLGTTGITGATYSWSGPASFSSTQQNPSKTTIQITDSGMYYLQVTVNNCVSPQDSVRVKVNPVPFLTIQSNPVDSICSGDPVVFTAFPNNHAGTPTYVWKINGVTSGTGIVFNTTGLNDADKITCEMTEYTKCIANYTDTSNEIKMTVFPWLAPTVSITASPSGPVKPNEYIAFTTVKTNAGVKPGYQWKRNGTDVLGATGNTWAANTLNDNDKISVELTSDYICPSPVTVMSNTITVSILTTITDAAIADNVNLYPNPNNGRFVIEGELTANDKPVKLSVVNALGQVVYRQQLDVHSKKLYHEIDLKHLANSGIYLLRLQQGDADEVVRFSIEK